MVGGRQKDVAGIWLDPTIIVINNIQYHRYRHIRCAITHHRGMHGWNETPTLDRGIHGFHDCLTELPADPSIREHLDSPMDVADRFRYPVSDP